MAGLVSYESSDDEDNAKVEASQPSKFVNKAEQALNGTKTRMPHDQEQNASLIIHTESKSQANGREASRQTPNVTAGNDFAIEGPVIGPTIPVDAQSHDLPEEDSRAPTQSPYSANRALLRDLTVPSIANLDIPPSPPGSPVGSTNAKFKHFLELKKKGVHFNEKLANSAAAKNPSLMQKLMDFSNIDEAGQYATTLPKELWNPKDFPLQAYKEELASSQREIGKRKEEEKLRGQRESVDFVPATAGDVSSRGGTPLGKSTSKSAAERIMAGLDRNRSNSPQVQGVKRKSRFDG